MAKINLSAKEIVQGAISRGLTVLGHDPEQMDDEDQALRGPAWCLVCHDDSPCWIGDPLCEERQCIRCKSTEEATMKIAARIAGKSTQELFGW